MQLSTDERQALSSFLEDEMLSVLSRLESDVTGLYDAGQLTPPPDVESAAVGIFYYMPTETFESLTSARKYLDLLLREIGWFVTSCNEQRWTYVTQGEAITNSNSRPTPPPPPNAGLTPTPSQQTRVLTFQILLQKWLRTFQSLKTTSEQSHNPDCLLAVTALSLRVTCASISSNCSFGPEIAYDAYIPDFEALHLVGRLHAGGPSPKSLRPTFITSSILIRSLYFIALKCRRWGVRVKALRILESMPRREGIWDAVLFVRLRGWWLVLRGGREMVNVD
ncbi:hypothetical protein DL95DRAFT_491657 [Leptodontidium sp. 2 PMI_412]|nr:hypothetical protein DL95DRAFT_491657 [Leptodontidium sp. 2 PMI_412]